jgi:hypothetical protein
VAEVFGTEEDGRSSTKQRAVCPLQRRPGGELPLVEQHTLLQHPASGSRLAFIDAQIPHVRITVPAKRTSAGQVDE